jgi:hypothetical protein
VQLILHGKNEEIGLENLEGMLKILPDQNEVTKEFSKSVQLF